LARSQKKISEITNKIFVSKTPVEIALFPIPEWLKDATCNCGQKAEYLLEDMKGICSGCLETTLGISTLKEIEDTSIPLTERSIRRLRFEWSTNTDRWYFVRGANLKPSNWTRFVQEVKESIVNHESLVFEGDYDKNLKELTIY